MMVLFRQFASRHRREVDAAYSVIRIEEASGIEEGLPRI